MPSLSPLSSLEYTYLACLNLVCRLFLREIVSACVTETLNAKKNWTFGRVKWGFLIFILKSKMADKTLFQDKQYAFVRPPNSPALHVSCVSFAQRGITAFLVVWGYFFSAAAPLEKVARFQKNKVNNYKNRPQGLETKIGGCREGVKLTFFLLSDRWNTLLTTSLVLIPASPLKNGQVNTIIDNRTHRKGFAQAEKRQIWSPDKSTAIVRKK